MKKNIIEIQKLEMVLLSIGTKEQLPSSTISPIYDSKSPNNSALSALATYIVIENVKMKVVIFKTA